MFNQFLQIENETLFPKIISKQKTETLADIILDKKNNEIVEAIKFQYKNIRGKRLKLMLLALQDLNLLPKDRIAFKFHKLCKVELNWDISSYTAMNDYKYNEFTDKTEFNLMKEFLETTIKTK
jgi:hypothetical protein